jgi:hypothetical protein
MIYDFWWDSGGRSSRFLADISAPKEVVERMAREYNERQPKVSFVTFLRTHNIPARNITPIEVEFYQREIETEDKLMTLAPDFALRAEIRQVQEKAVA